MAAPSWIRNLFARPNSRRVRRSPQRVRLAFAPLENRVVPAVIVVNSAQDNVNDAVITGPTVTLRQAINYANTNADFDTITFASSLDTTPILLSQGELQVSTSLEIVGNGENNTIIDGNKASRILLVQDLNGTATTQDVFLSGMTLQNGVANSKFAHQGGGILNDENLSTTNVTITNNTARDAGGVYNNGKWNAINVTIAKNDASILGGGVYVNGGSVTLTHSTVAGNRADSAGGVYVNGGSVVVTNSTVANNISGSNGGGMLVGGGSVVLTNSTVAGNAASYFYGGVRVDGGSLELGNTLVVGNTAPFDRDMPAFGFVNKGGNLIGVPALSSLDKIVRVDANNKPLLANNGGPTQTIALVPGSPAINTGKNENIPVGVTTDQRGIGFNRILNGSIDIGAYESAETQLRRDDDGRHR